MIFLYDDIQWAEYGYEAVAGMNAGDNVNHITIPGSMTLSILNITETSNVGVPGVWIFSFKLDGGTCIIAYAHVHMCICTYIHTYVRTCTYIHMYVHMFASVTVCKTMMITPVENFVLQLQIVNEMFAHVYQK